MMRSTAHRSRWLMWLFCGLALWLAGCRNGPPGESVKQRLQSKLDVRFGKGVFTVDQLGRRGSYPYREQGDTRPHLLVYFDARIRFARAYKLSEWDKPNVGSLVALLGATAHGIEGVKTAGNQIGDLLEVHGSSAFANEGGQWKAVARAAASPTGSAALRAGPDPERPEAYRAELDKLGGVGRELRRRGPKGELSRFEDDLRALVARSERRLAQSRGWLTLATGPLGGRYAVFGLALAKALDGKGHAARAFITSGSADNCRMVQAGEIRYALVQNDIAAMARAGRELFAGEAPLGRLRALGTLYPEAVQLAVLTGSAIDGVAALKGKRVDLGVLGSGGRLNARQLLTAAGIDLGDLAVVQGKPPALAAEDLAAGRIDAMLVTSALPSPALAAVAARAPLRLVGLGEALVAELTEKHAFFVPLRVPKQSYPGMAVAAGTVAVTAMLVARDDAADEQVTRVLGALFGDGDKLGKGSVHAYYVSRDRALTAVSIPLHPAAARFLGTH